MPMVTKRSVARPAGKKEEPKKTTKKKATAKKK